MNNLPNTKEEKKITLKDKVETAQIALLAFLTGLAIISLLEYLNARYV